MEQNTQRWFQGVWIEKKIWLNKQLTIMEKVMYIEIQSLQGENNEGCFASNDYFCNFFWIKTRQVQNIIKSLKEKGLIYQDWLKAWKFRILKINDFNEFEKNNTNYIEIITVINFILINSIKDYKEVLNIINKYNLIKLFKTSEKWTEMLRLILWFVNNKQDLNYSKIKEKIIWNTKDYFNFVKAPKKDNLINYINLLKNK